MGRPSSTSNIALPLPARLPGKAAPSCSSLQWWLARYRETTDLGAALSAATRRQRDNIFARVLEKAGQEPYAWITTATILAGKDRGRRNPRIRLLSGLLKVPRKDVVALATCGGGKARPSRYSCSGQAATEGNCTTAQPSGQARRQGPRVRIISEYGSPEFDIEYRAALAGAPARKAAPSCSSLQWLLARYRETTDWARFPPPHVASATTSLRGCLRRPDKSRMRGSPRPRSLPARSRLDTGAGAEFSRCERGLFKWALKADLLSPIRLPASTTRRASAAKGSSLGLRNTSRPTRRAGLSACANGYGLTYCLYTGLRLGDAVRLVVSMCGTVSPGSGKSGFTIEVRCRSCRCCPRHLLPDLAATSPNIVGVVADGSRRRPLAICSGCLQSRRRARISSRCSQTGGEPAWPTMARPSRS